MPVPEIYLEYLTNFFEILHPPLKSVANKGTKKMSFRKISSKIFNENNSMLLQATEFYSIGLFT